MLGEQQQQRVRTAQGVLVEQHWVRLYADLALAVIVFFLVLEFLFADYLLVFEVDVEENLSLVLLQ